MQKAAGGVIAVRRCVAMFAQENEAEAGRPGERQDQRREQRCGHGDGERAKEAAGDSAHRDQGQKHNHRRDGGTDERGSDFAQRLAHRLHAGFAGVAVHDDVFDHHDGVVDHKPDGCGQAPERHQVEALPDEPQHQDRHGDGDRDDKTRDQRRGPIAEEEEENDAGENETDEDRVAHAGNGIAHQLRLIVEGLEPDARRKLLPQLGHLGCDGIGHSDSVARRLPRDIDAAPRLFRWR